VHQRTTTTAITLISSFELAVLTPRAAGRDAPSPPSSPAQQRFHSCQRPWPAGGKGAGDRRRLWQHAHIGMAPRRSDCRLGTCLATRKRKGGRHQGKSPLHLFTSSRLAGRLFGRLWGRAARPRFLGRLRGRTSFCAQRVSSSASPIYLISVDSLSSICSGLRASCPCRYRASPDGYLCRSPRRCEGAADKSARPLDLRYPPQYCPPASEGMGQATSALHIRVRHPVISHRRRTPVNTLSETCTN
jgi:hypothetical protein